MNAKRRTAEQLLRTFIAGLILLVPTFGVGGLLFYHAFSNANWGDIDTGSTYEVYQNDHATGIFLSGDYVYTSGKALEAYVSVPFLLGGFLAIYFLYLATFTESDVEENDLLIKLLASIVGGSVIAFPIYAIGFGNILGTFNPIIAMLVPIVAIILVFFKLRNFQLIR